MFAWLYRRRRHGPTIARRLALAASVRIADVPDGGRVRVTGIAERDDELCTAPLSARECVYWMVVIDEVGSGDADERGVADGGVPFLVRDDSGTASVIPGKPDVALAPYRVLRPPTGTLRPSHMLEPEERALIDRLGIKLNYPTTSWLRFSELIVAPGARLSILGGAQREPVRAQHSDDTGYRTALPTRPVFSGTRRSPLALGDEPA